MHDSGARADGATTALNRILIPADRLLDALTDQARRARTMAFLLLGFVAQWTLFGVLSHGGVDVHADVAEGMLWSREPSLQHHPPMMAWVYKAWFTVFPVTDWASYLLASTAMGITLWIVWILLGDWLDDRKRVAGLALLTLVPLYTFHATKLNANTVMMPFWAAATLYFLRSFHSCASGDAVRAGVAGAGAILAKYWSFYLVAGLGIAALFNSGRARYFLSPAPWISIGIGVILLVPYVLGLAENPRALDFAAQAGLATGIRGALRETLEYLAGSLGYVFMFVLALAVMRPRRAALADLFAPATEERRLVAVIFWLPLLLPALINFVFPHRLASLWTYPNWSLLPVVLLSSPLIIVERRIAVRILGLALVVPLLAVLAAPVISYSNHRSRAADKNARYSLVAHALDKAWRDVTARPLRWTGGSQPIFARSAFYLPPSARYLTPLSTPKSVEAIVRDGAALVCQASDANCVAEIRSAAKNAANSRSSEIELSRSYLGIDGKRERFVIIVIPPA